MTKTPNLNHPDTLVANCAGCDAQLPCGTVQYPKPWPHRIKGRPYCPTCVQASQLKLSPFCAHDDATANALRLLERIQELRIPLERLSMFTGTVRSELEIGRDTWRRMHSYFGRWMWLTRTMFGGAIRGAAAFLETTYSEHGWHPHVHAMLDSDYVAQAHLSVLWTIATSGAGYVVDVRRIRAPRGNDDPKQALRDAVIEVSKYPAKVSQIDDPARLLELRRSVRRVHLMESFGNFRRDSADDASAKEAEERLTTCPFCDGTEIYTYYARVEGAQRVRLLALGARAQVLVRRALKARAGPAPPPRLSLPNGMVACG